MASPKYHIEYAQSAIEDLRALPKREAEQILRKIQRLENGLIGNIKRLQNADVGYRLRMGNYRILFDVAAKRITVQKIGHRKDVYE